MRINESVEDCVMETGLEIAGLLLKQGRLAEAELQYKRILECAEQIAGQSSPVVGIIILELIDLYDKTDRAGESAELWSRLRSIMLGSFQQLWTHEMDGNFG